MAKKAKTFKEVQSAAKAAKKEQKPANDGSFSLAARAHDRFGQPVQWK